MLTGLKKALSKAAGSHCASCKVCRYAKRKPESTLAGAIRWHQSWCPAYSAYKKQLESLEATQ